MTRVSGPLAPRRSIGELLRSKREAAGLGLEQVASAVLFSSSKLSRIETSQGLPSPRDVRDLSAYYELTKEETERLGRWVASAKNKGWWVDYSQTLPEGLDSHISYESDADVECVYTLPVLPVLLHTENYMRELYRSYEPESSEDRIEELVQARKKRQSILYKKDNPLRLIAITHESSLWQVVGSPEVMSEQMSHLLEVLQLSNVELQILPFTVSPLFTTGCMYAVLSFADEFAGDVVTVESHAGFRYLTDDVQTQKYRGYFDNLREKALNAEATRSRIEDARMHFDGQE